MKKHIKHYPILLLASFLMMFKSFVYAHGLSITAYGVVAKVILWSNTLMIVVGLGLQSYAQKKFPEYFDKNRMCRIYYASGIFLLFSVGITAVLFLVLLVYCLTGHALGPVLLLPLYILSQVFYFYATNIVRARQAFVFYSSVMLAKAVGVILLVLLYLCFYQSPYMVLWIEIILNLLFFIFLKPPLLFGLKLLFKKWVTNKRRAATVLKNITKSSFLLMCVNGLLILYYGFDNVAASFILPKHVYATYAFAALFFSILTVLQTIVNSNLYAHMSIYIGRQEGRRVLQLLNKASLVVVLVYAALYFPMMWIIQLGIKYFIPKYLVSVGIIKLLMISGFFRLVDFYTSYLILNDKESAIIVVAIIFLVLNVCVLGVLHYYTLTSRPIMFAYLSLALSVVMYIYCCCYANKLGFFNASGAV